MSKTDSNKKMRPRIGLTRHPRLWAALAILTWLGLALYGGTAAAKAAPVDDYFYNLRNQGVVVWDYPSITAHGAAACGLLYEDVNPMGWLVYTIGYDYSTAGSIIVSAQQALCPGNAVTGSPDYLEAL